MKITCYDPNYRLNIREKYERFLDWFLEKAYVITDGVLPSFLEPEKVDIKTADKKLKEHEKIYHG